MTLNPGALLHVLLMRQNLQVVCDVQSADVASLQRANVVDVMWNAGLLCQAIRLYIKRLNGTGVRPGGHRSQRGCSTLGVVGIHDLRVSASPFRAGCKNLRAVRRTIGRLARTGFIWIRDAALLAPQPFLFSMCGGICSCLRRHDVAVRSFVVTAVLASLLSIRLVPRLLGRSLLITVNHVVRAAACVRLLTICRAPLRHALAALGATLNWVRSHCGASSSYSVIEVVA